MGGCRRLALRGQFHQPGYIDLRGWRAARAVTLDTGESMLGIAFAPARDLHPPKAQLLCNRFFCLPSAASKTIRARCIRRFRLAELLPRLARARVLCKPWPEPKLRAVGNFHG